ncbi:hypothetical protein [Roseivirga pacifica]|uniref:hypothetical protein n=1 Tax=Roseivirga pacifica TaxID=1267423 RepID=UPI00227C9FBB|nr:hypothetical protein [Roseivirga pacifica]
MKKLSIKLSLALLFLVAAISANAQDYTIDVSNPSGAKLMIKEVNRVSVEAYDGNSIQISTGKAHKDPERAEGLTALSARGKDNTGIGLNVEQGSGDITIYQVARRGEGKYTIKVPKSMKVSIEHTGNWEGGKIEVYGVSAELEIAGTYNSVYMENVTGPALVNTVYGEVEAVFGSLSQVGPTSLVSVYSAVDVTIPAATKADVTIKTPYGEAYSDLDIQFPDSEGMRKLNSTIDGKLNGGGVKLDLKASYGNVYLRKK